MNDLGLKPVQNVDISMAVLKNFTKCFFNFIWNLDNFKEINEILL
jgi:hypothetical protein